MLYEYFLFCTLYRTGINDDYNGTRESIYEINKELGNVTEALFTTFDKLLITTNDSNHSHYIDSDDILLLHTKKNQKGITW